MAHSPILETAPLGFPWQTQDPFLFCVHHDDRYPAGNERMGPDASLAGRRLGMDFEGIDGWRMYHGRVVPGFPSHPHRGFETVTLARRGFIDHSDSLGATARFGRGDVQWMTAGGGIQHSEMFPLLDREGPNHTELFQLWLNLPKTDKLVDPHFKMLWSETIPTLVTENERGQKTSVVIVAGELAGKRGPTPPPSSWAARPDTDVGIWTIDMEPGATWTLPKTHETTARTLYVYRRGAATVAGTVIEPGHLAALQAEESLRIEAGEQGAELLMLQGRPIQEPIMHYGPFVMNTQTEIEQAIRDYRQTRYGGWPWRSEDPVHPRDAGRFARHADGRVETATEADRAPTLELQGQGGFAEART